MNVNEITETAPGTVQTPCRRPAIIDGHVDPLHIMSKIVRVGLLSGVTLAFAAGAAEAAAQGMGSGPIQTLPWAAKQRSKPNKESQKVDED